MQSSSLVQTSPVSPVVQAPSYTEDGSTRRELAQSEAALHGSPGAPLAQTPGYVPSEEQMAVVHCVSCAHASPGRPLVHTPGFPSTEEHSPPEQYSPV